MSKMQKSAPTTPQLLLAGFFCAASLAVTRAADQCSAPTPLGCFQDPYTDPSGKLHRVLSHQVASADSAMTAVRCVALCCKAGFAAGALAGVEDGGDCFCAQSFGPYTIPNSRDCNVSCTGSPTNKCGGKGALEAVGISSCPGNIHDEPWRDTDAAAASLLQQCGQKGCTSCPKEDTCCKGKPPDSYKVEGGYGCSPPLPLASGCASGGAGKNAGLPAQRCCCGLGPSLVSSSLPNVLVIGDSVSDGYVSFVAKALNGTANVGHGPNNAGGGCADGAAYGAFCTKYFVRTPHYELPPWDVITFNYGLHDGADTNSSYLDNMITIADELLATAKTANPARPSRIVYFATTIPGGANSVPGEPVSPDDKRVIELNAIANGVMAQRNITVVDLYATMTACGKPCAACKPHCGAPGYEYLVDNAIVPAIKKALAQS